MLAKVITYGETRDEARRKLVRAVEQCVLLGVNGNQRFLANLLKNPEFAAGNATTAFIAEHFADDPSLHPHTASLAELAMAAALLYQISADARAHQPGLSGWRSAGSAPWRFVLKQGEHKHSVELDVLSSGPQAQLRVRRGEEQLSLRLLASDGRWLTLELDGVRRRQAYHIEGEHLWLYGEHGNLELVDVTHEPAGGQNAASSGAVKAPMDGAIVDVLVAEGASVSKGQLLVVLEAMKMEHPLKAGVDGIVRRVGVSQGDQVKNRQLLVEIEAAEV
jgi:geranyl-CoA carboxylase alpha subunit